MIHWFGTSWGAPVCVPDTHVQTPVGQPCGFCEAKIKEEDRGLIIPDWELKKPITYHLSCFMSAIGIQVVHVLESGRPLCKFSILEPGRWPTGNIWVSRFDPDVTQLVTCHRCKKELKQ
jgi:hypothetical protein